MTRYAQELIKLHKLIIHDSKSVTDNSTWYKLARRETKIVAKYKDAAFICQECFGKVG